MSNTTIFSYAAAYDPDVLLKKDFFDLVYENYNGADRLVVLMAGFIGDRLMYEHDKLVARLRADEYPKLQDEDIDIEIRGLAQQYILPTKKDSTAKFITELDGATKTDPRSESEFLGNLFYIATEQVAEWINATLSFEVSTGSVQYQLFFLLPYMPNGELFGKVVVPAAQAWFDRNYGNIKISAVLDVALTDASHAN